MHRLSRASLSDAVSEAIVAAIPILLWREQHPDAHEKVGIDSPEASALTAHSVIRRVDGGMDWAEEIAIHLYVRASVSSADVL